MISNNTSMPTTDDELQKNTVGELKPHNAPITLVEYDSSWPELFEQESNRIHSVLGSKALQIEHVGSTSVPGLCAKPIIDILLVVKDSADESSYVPVLEAAGYVLQIRSNARSQYPADEPDFRKTQGTANRMFLAYRR